MGLHGGRRPRAIALLAVPSLLLLGACTSEPEAAPVASDPPAPSVSPTTSLSPSPSPAPSDETWPPAAFDEQSPLEPVAEGEPLAYAPFDGLLDWVDDEWSTAIFSTVDFVDDPDSGPLLEGVQHLYLVAPDGTAFRVTDLGSDAFGTIVDWDPARAKAWVHLQGWGESWSVVEVDLATGEIDDGDFTEGEGPRATAADLGLSQDILPVMVDDAGARLWVAIDPFGGFGGASWYDPTSGEWRGERVNDAMLDIVEARHERGDDGPHSPGPVGGSGWLDVRLGRYLVMIADEGPIEVGTESTYALFDVDLDTGDVETATFEAPLDVPGCGISGVWKGDPLVTCSDWWTESADALFTVDVASGAVAPVSEDTTSDRAMDLGSYTEDVKAGDVPPGAEAWTDLMPAPDVVD